MSNHNEPHVLKAGVWYTINKFLLAGLGFITMPLFTRLMSQTDIGIYSNFSSWVNFFTILFTLNLSSAVALSKYRLESEMDTFIFSMAVLGNIVTVGGGIILLCCSRTFVQIFAVPAYAIVIMIVYLLLNPAYTLAMRKFQIYHRYKPIAFFSVGTAIISTAITLAAVLLSGEEDRLFARIMTYYGFMAITGAVAYIYVMRKGKRIKVSHWKFALPIALPIVLHNLSGVILNASDKVMITILCGARMNGLYSIAYGCSMVVPIFRQAIVDAYAPWMYDKLNEKDYATIGYHSGILLIFFLVIVTGMMLIAPDALLILGGRGYMEAKYVIPPIMTGYVFNFIYVFYVDILFFYDKRMTIARNTMISSVLNIILNYLLLPVYGYIAAAYTTLFGFFIMFVLDFIAVKKLGYEKIYSTRFHFMYLVISLLLMILILFIYKYDTVRYIVTGSYGIAILILGLKYKSKLLTVIHVKKALP